MRRSGQPSRPRERICCLLSSPKMLAIPAGNHALHRRVNVLGRRYFTGRFSGVHDWPVWVSTEGRNETRRLSLIYLRRGLVTVSRTVTSAFLTPRGSNRARTRVGRDARRAAISCAAFSKVPDPLSSSQSSQVIAAPPPRTNKEGIKRLSSA